MASSTSHWRCPSVSSGCCSLVSASTRYASSVPASCRNSVLDSEQSPQKNPDRCSRTSSSTSASSSPSVGCRPRGVGEDRPVGGRVAEELGDQDRVRVGVPRGRLVQVDRDPDHLDGGDAQLGQRPEQPVLAPGQPLAELLEGVQRAVVVDEADHVPRDAPLPDLDQPFVLPFRQRLGPRQREQSGRVVGGGSEDEPHTQSFAESTAGRLSALPAAGRAAMLAPLITTATRSPGAGL